MSATARKRFGQHFLVDRGVIASIVDAIDARPGETLVEIGPGRAALTAALLERVDRLQAVEIDRDLAQWLRSRFDPSRLQIIEADALAVDYTVLATGHPVRLVGNLPYNISSPLLLCLIAHRQIILDQHFMLQKEVVERISAAVGESAYGRLTVMLQAHYQVEHLFDVGPAAFDPPPRVDSAVIRMRPWPNAAELPLATLERLTAVAFAQKRKMLRKTLIPWLDRQGVDASRVDPTARAEDVPVEVYCELATQLAAQDGLRSISSIL